MISCGSESSAILTKRGEIYTWGLNIKGQLGNGTYDTKYEPELVESLLPSDSKLSSGSKSSMFFMKRSKSREQMKNKTQTATTRPSKSTTPEDRSSEYKDFKPSKSVDLTHKNSGGANEHYDPSSDNILHSGEYVIEIA